MSLEWNSTEFLQCWWKLIWYEKIFGEKPKNRDKLIQFGHWDSIRNLLAKLGLLECSLFDTPSRTPCPKTKTPRNLTFFPDHPWKFSFLLKLHMPFLLQYPWKFHITLSLVLSGIAHWRFDYWFFNALSHYCYSLLF